MSNNKDNRGGYRENAQRPPIFDETMEKYFIELPREMVAYLDSTGKRERAENLRALLQWASASNVVVDILFDPGGGSDLVGRRYALRTDDSETAVRLGAGNRTAGVRRVIFTAMRSAVDLTSLKTPAKAS